VDRPEVNWLRRNFFDLLPQLGDAIVDSATTGALPLWPDRGDQFPARHHDPWPRDQESQDFEFLQSQPYRLIGPAEFHFSEIQGNLTEPSNPCGLSDPEIRHNSVPRRPFRTNVSRTTYRVTIRDLSEMCHIVVKSACAVRERFDSIEQAWAAVGAERACS
jgi:hypothetical protein